MLNKWILACLILGIIASAELAAFRGRNIRRKSRQRSYHGSRTRNQYGGQGWPTYGRRTYGRMDQQNFRTTQPSQTRTRTTQRPKVNPLQHLSSPRTIVRAEPKTQYGHSHGDGESPTTTRSTFIAYLTTTQNPLRDLLILQRTRPEIQQSVFATFISALGTRLSQTQPRGVKQIQPQLRDSTEQGERRTFHDLIHGKRSRSDGESHVSTKPTLNAHPITSQDLRYDGQDTSMNIDHVPPTELPSMLSTPTGFEITRSLGVDSNRRRRLLMGEGNFTGDMKLHCLQNGENGTCSHGVVLVYNYEERRWRTICGHNWSRKNAKVVCKYLGFRKGNASDKNSLLLPNLRQYNFMRDVHCNGSEWTLTDCHEGQFEQLNMSCTGNTLAVVECEGKRKRRCKRKRCPESTFQCHADKYGVRCIPENRVCDGIRDCPRGTDESSADYRPTTAELCRIPQ